MVSKEEGENLAKEYGIQFFETSAKNDQNVETGFTTVAREVKDRLIADGGGGGNRGAIKPDGKKVPKKGGCC